eukprot:scaffold1697_cov120-Cylindrotheca_fusiformis.AAC.20
MSCVRGSFKGLELVRIHRFWILVWRNDYFDYCSAASYLRSEAFPFTDKKKIAVIQRRNVVLGEAWSARQVTPADATTSSRSERHRERFPPTLILFVVGGTNRSFLAEVHFEDNFSV